MQCAEELRGDREAEWPGHFPTHVPQAVAPCCKIWQEIGNESDFLPEMGLF